MYLSSPFKHATHIRWTPNQGRRYHLVCLEMLWLRCAFKDWLAIRFDKSLVNAYTICIVVRSDLRPVIEGKV